MLCQYGYVTQFVSKTLAKSNIKGHFVKTGAIKGHKGHRNRSSVVVEARNAKAKAR